MKVLHIFRDTLDARLPNLAIIETSTDQEKPDRMGKSVILFFFVLLISVTK